MIQNLVRSRFSPIPPPPYHLSHMDTTPIYQFSAPKGDFLQPPPPSTPITTPGYQLCPGLIAMVREQSFGGLERESPYLHLREFEQLCGCLVISGMPGEALRWLLFPFSLTGNAKAWYNLAVGKAEGSLQALKNSFCLHFFRKTRLSIYDVRYSHSGKGEGNPWEQRGHALGV